MSNEATLKTIVAFDKMPSTPEKDRICRLYLDDEIGSFELYSLARDYLTKAQQEKK